MKETDIKNELKDIEGLIKHSVNGIKKNMLIVKSGVNKRTLHRRLSQLIKEKRIVTVGAGKSLKYVSAPEKVQVLKSQSGLEIESYLRQPLESRKPVGYNMDFLDAYIPNITHYLSEPLRKQLAKLGSLPAEQSIGGTAEKNIYSRLLIDLSWASSKLEGNTYSLLDTKNLIEFGKIAEGKDLIETQMILNHKNAIEAMIRYKDSLKFNSYTILNLHGILSEKLLADPQDEGRLRQKTVGIGGSSYEPMFIPQKVEEYFNIILDKAEQIKDPFEQSFFVMVHIPYLQPFTDVNKRMSRLMLNIPFIKNGLSPVSFRGVPKDDYLYATLGIYELNRVELLQDVFVWAYGQSAQLYATVKQELVPPDPFLRKYRNEVYASVRAIVKQEPVNVKIPQEDLLKFNEVVEQQIALLHEGNLMRVGLTLEDFRNWQNKSSLPESSGPESSGLSR